MEYDIPYPIYIPYIGPYNLPLGVICQGRVVTCFIGELFYFEAAQMGRVHNGVATQTREADNYESSGRLECDREKDRFLFVLSPRWPPFPKQFGPIPALPFLIQAKQVLWLTQLGTLFQWTMAA